MKKITQKLMLLFLLFLASLGYSQKAAIIGMNHATPDGFTFLVTQDLANGEVIYFTENEYSDAANAFVDAGEAVVVFTATSAITKGNVVFVNELATANTFSVSCTGGGCGTAVISGAGPFALATDGETFYAYTDSDSNPINGITTIYSVMYTGSGEVAPPVNGGNIPNNENPIFDFPNAIVVDGFPFALSPGAQPNRVEFNPTTLARTNVLKVGLENPNNYVHAQPNAALSTLFFTNFSLLGANPTLGVTASPASVNENSGTGMVYTFTLSANATSNLTINFAVGGSATFTSDYTQSGAASFNASSGTVTIASGSSSASITLTPVGDTTLEANELITLTLSAGTGYDIGSPAAASTTIVNDDTSTITPIVAICGINHDGTQNGFSFVALQSIAAGTVVYFTENPFDRSILSFSGAESVMQWTAPAGGLARGQVVVATETSTNVLTTTCSGGTCGSMTLVSGNFTLASVGEELYVYLDTDSNHTNGVTSVQAVLYTGTTVTSGGPIPALQNPALAYTGAVVVDGFPAIPPIRTEYNPTLRGVTVDRANFQNITNWLNGQSSTTLSTVPFANIIISSGVANPFATVTVSPSSVLENSGTAMVYTFALSSAAVGAITINFTVSGTATFTTDYTASGASSFTASTGSVVIPNGASSATVSVTPVGDITLEVQESIILAITSGTAYDAGSPNAATGNINNDDTSSSQPLIALTGIAHVDPDGLSFAAAQDIPANSVIYFTDNSYDNNTLLFSSGEVVLRWTSPASIITKGNVVVITESSPDVFTLTCSNGTCGSLTLISGNLALATTGETLYAYRDTDTNPSNGVADIYSVIYTGNGSGSGGPIPAIEDPSNIFLKALVVQGFPTTAPARTEYNPALRNVLVTAANFENIANWIHAQTPPALSTVPFTNLNIVDNTPPNAICQNISVTPNIVTGTITIAASQINNNSTDNIGIATYALNISTFTCANIGTPVTVTLTVTDTSGNTSTCNAIVTVLPNAVATFNQVAPICSGGSFTLPTTSTNGTTGTWSPAINNTATITYTFTPNAGQCASSTTMSVVVNPNVTPTFTAVAPICAGGSLSALPTTSTNSITGTWAPALNNAATTTYTFTPTAGQCGTTTTLTITVNPNVTPTFTAVSAICAGGSLSALPTTSNNGIVGSWSPALDNANTTTYTFTPTAGQCATTTTLTITVNPNVTPTFTAVAPICAGGSLSALPTTSNNGITGTWSPALDNANTTTYTFSPTAGQCATTATLSITVNPTNVTPTFTAVASICSGGSLSALPTTSNNGIAGTWSPALDNANTTTYTFTPTAGLCATTTTLTITVNPNVTPTFTAVAAICSGGSLSALPTTSNNGITGTWSPALDDANTTTYTFTPTAGQCATTATLSITVNPNVTPTFTAVAAICSGGSLSALPTTSNNGITGTWSPALDNANTTTYTFSPTAGQCATTTTLTITVNPNVTPTFTAVAAICAGGSLSALPTTSNNGITGTWSPALNNAATTIYTFIPTVGQCATTTTLTITVNPSPPGDTLATAINVVGLNYTTTGNNLASNCYTNTIGSTSPDVWYKVTIEPCVRTISLNTCSGTNYDSRLRVYAPDGTTQLANNDDYCGLQSGIDNLNVSLYSFVYVIVEGFTTNQGNYGLSISQNVVNTATFAAVAPICSGSVLTALPTSSIEGFTGTWSPALDNTQTTTYTFTPDANQCATATVTLTIVVNPIPVVAITGATSICAGDSVTLTANGADTYSWNSIFLPTTIPLDNVSNARLAIGLRKLKTTYTGPCVRLRRSSDNAESDFGFSGNDLDSSAVTTWLNGATGYCVTLYDQSGNGGDVSQSSTFNQPTLTLNGFNGKPVLHFNTQQLLLNNVNYPSSYTAIYGARQTGGARARVLSAVNNNWLLGYWGGAKRQAYFEGWISSNPGNPASDDNYYIYSGASDGSTSQLYENGTLIENNGNGVASPNGIELNGWINGSEMSDCDFTDVFVFDTVLNTTDRAFVENSTKNYYNPIPTPSITVSPTVTTTYTVTGTNAIGCSATASITVTVNPVTSNTSTISACNSYLWTVNGTTYTTSGTYTSVVNCNTETLILTINNSTTNGSLTTSAAGSYTWAGPLGSGLTYNTSGVYTFTTTNAFGCPNVATLNLTITSVATVNTFVIGTSCGSTITNLSVTIIAPFVSGATLYTFRLTNLVTNVVQLINRPVNSFALSGFAGVTLGTPYKVEVSVNNGPFGAPCNVITPTPVATIGTQCGTTLTAMSQFVYCNFVANVTGYRFRVTNTTTSTIQIFDSGLNRFNFNQLPNRSFSTTYFVEVALRNTDGTYLPYNTGCNILTPSFPTSEIRLSQCDYNALSNTESFVATLVSGATEYRFNIFNTSLGYTSTLDRTLNTFNLNMFSGLLAGTTYSVRVAVKIGGVFGPYGKICNLTTPGGTRMVATTKVKEFKAILYPNPFAESFMLDVKNSTESTIQIKVYDMLGRLVDNRDVEISDITSIQVGATYPSGVYNVIISQDANTQTIRVIKR